MTEQDRRDALHLLKDETEKPIDRLARVGVLLLTKALEAELEEIERGKAAPR